MQTPQGTDLRLETCLCPCDTTEINNNIPSSKIILKIGDEGFTLYVFSFTPCFVFLLNLKAEITKLGQLVPGALFETMPRGT